MIQSNFINYLKTSSGLPRLNYLLEGFPDFSPDEFNEFLNEKEENVELLNYILHSIYPILLKDLDNSEQSLKNIKKLLNEIYDDSLILLLRNKMKNFINWYSEKEIQSYFSLIEEKRILGLLYYIIHNFSTPERIYSSTEELKRMGGYLLLYLEDNSITSLTENELFLELFDDIKTVFSEAELSIFVKKKANYLSIINFTKENSIYYAASLSISDKSDILSVINLLISEFESFRSKIKMHRTVISETFISTRSGIYIKLEYLIELVKLFPNEKQENFLKELIQNETTSKLIREYDKEITQCLLKDNFKIIEEIKNFKKTKYLF